MKFHQSVFLDSAPWSMDDRTGGPYLVRGPKFRYDIIWSGPWSDILVQNLLERSEVRYIFGPIWSGPKLLGPVRSESLYVGVISTGSLDWAQIAYLLIEGSLSKFFHLALCICIRMSHCMTVAASILLSNDPTASFHHNRFVLSPWAAPCITG